MMSILAEKSNSLIAEIAFSADCEDNHFRTEKIYRIVIQNNRVYKISVQLNTLKREKKTFSSLDTSRQKGL
ncbi:UNVERIFIED_CONTAM: hypothetical protein NCL1_24612 [Trichonephila clavipes]